MPDIDKKWTGIVEDMDFEHLVCQVLGYKNGYHSCSSASNTTNFRRLMLKIVQQLERRADNLASDERLKDLLHMYFRSLQTKLSKLNTIHGFGDLFVNAMRIISALLGYDGLDKEILRTPVYSQTLEQLSVSEKGHRDPLDWIERRKNLRAVRAGVVGQLKQAGLKDPEIAFVLNISDHEIKKLRQNYRRTGKLSNRTIP